MKLYELTNQLMELQEIMEDPEADVDSFQAAIDAVELEINEKAEAIGKLIRNIEGSVNACKAEETRLANKRKAMNSRIDYLKQYVKGELKKADLKSAGTELMHFNIQATAESVKIEDEAAFIDWCRENELVQYLKLAPPTIAKTEVKKALKRGDALAGARLEKGETIVLK